MYVGIRSEVASFPVSVLNADPEEDIELADLGTRLDKLKERKSGLSIGATSCATRDCGLMCPSRTA